MKVKLTPELDKKYGSQLEYMGHNQLTTMELNDGNTAVVENGDFYIVFKPISNTLPLVIPHLENEYIGKVLSTFRNSFVPNEFTDIDLSKEKDILNMTQPIAILADKDEDLNQIITLTLSHINKAEFRHFAKEIIPGIKIVEIRDLLTDKECFLVFSSYEAIKQTLIYALNVVLFASITDISLIVKILRNRFGSAGTTLFKIDIMKLDIVEV